MPSEAVLLLVAGILVLGALFLLVLMLVALGVGAWMVFRRVAQVEMTMAVIASKVGKALGAVSEAVKDERLVHARADINEIAKQARDGVGSNMLSMPGLAGNGLRKREGPQRFHKALTKDEEFFMECETLGGRYPEGHPMAGRELEGEDRIDFEDFHRKKAG